MVVVIAPCNRCGRGSHYPRGGRINWVLHMLRGCCRTAKSDFDATESLRYSSMIKFCAVPCFGLGPQVGDISTLCGRLMPTAGSDRRYRRIPTNSWFRSRIAISRLQTGHPQHHPRRRASDLDRRGAPRNGRRAIMSPRALRAPRGRLAPNNRPPPVLRLRCGPSGARGASCAGLWSAHAAGMVSRQQSGDEQWQQSAL